MRRLISKGIHKVLGIERFMSIISWRSPREADKYVGLLLDGEPNVRRGDFITGRRKKVDEQT